MLRCWVWIIWKWRYSAHMNRWITTRWILILSTVRIVINLGLSPKMMYPLELGHTDVMFRVHGDSYTSYTAPENILCRIWAMICRRHHVMYVYRTQIVIKSLFSIFMILIVQAWKYGVMGFIVFLIFFIMKILFITICRFLLVDPTVK